MRSSLLQECPKWMFIFYSFLYGLQKIFTNKNIIYMFCLYNFSVKCIIKKKLFTLSDRGNMLNSVFFHRNSCPLCMKA